MSWIRRAAILRWSVVVVVALVGAGCVFGPVMADEPAKIAPGVTPMPPVEINTVRLKHAKASDVTLLLQKMFQPAEYSIRFVADNRTNSVIIRGIAAQIAEIRKAILTVDIEGEDAEAPPPKISIFELGALEPGQHLEESLRIVMGKTGKFAVDRIRKNVIISADPKTTAAVEALLTRLDKMRTTRPEEDVQVRVVWLVSGVDQEKALTPPTMPPDDLKKVLPGLVKLGINQPLVVAQFVVNAQPNVAFQAKGTAKLGVAPCTLSLSGSLDNQKEPPGLDINIRVTRGAVPGKEDICNLQTTISAPSGHLVVLGVTPTDNMTSAFVVQVVRKDGQKK